MSANRASLAAADFSYHTCNAIPLDAQMYWYPGGRANNSTSCIEEDGAWESHR